ncbi:WD40-repeat-containing domain protein [Schizothecium vesticola]|uniref:WD40-repeat-containing domain protein n=1 Tax=Schizothecium vesticola TaxID=314040 RepID=A0AA40K069_9PEZI|nr:WD40-repeat-containing domain protein [Schizothecium vesticola]
MKELLDTDRVNFLVWRYLLESNYPETAAKLQKEWRVHAPHRQFDFAPHVNTYALVSLLNKGLVYEDFQRQYADETRQVSRDGTATSDERGVFGLLKFEPSPRDEEAREGDDEGSDMDADGEIEELENPRKRPSERPHHALPNGSPASKRQRLSNGYENGADAATTAMDIDHHDADNNHAYPSPLEREQAQSPLPRTQGPDQGTQLDKVDVLTHQTVFLRLGRDDASGSSSLPPAPAAAQASENPMVLQCMWNPQDPSLLAASGTDALARVWTVSRGTATDDPLSGPGHVNGHARPFRNLFDDDLPRSTIVSAIAWSNNGKALALAAEMSKEAARISILGIDGTSIQRIDGIEPPVIKLLWSPDDSYVVGIGPEKGGTLLTVLSSSTSESVSHLVPEHDLYAFCEMDATWISNTEFVVCGGDTLRCLQVTEQGIAPGTRQFNSGQDEAFLRVQYDPHTKLLATASEKGTVDLWDENGQRRTFSAHTNHVTALQWQPLRTEAVEDERLLASGGEDGAICIWNVKSADNKPKYSMTMNLPVICLSITPDGAFIAGATAANILIWKMGETAFPRACWERVPHPGWQSPKGGADDEEENISMSWDAEGQKLVYGAHSRLAVINFR